MVSSILFDLDYIMRYHFKHLKHKNPRKKKNQGIAFKDYQIFILKFGIKKLHKKLKLDPKNLIKIPSKIYKVCLGLNSIWIKSEQNLKNSI